jgi:hypothetical protein
MANDGKRLVLISFAIHLTNQMGVVSSNIFRNQDVPNYIPALTTMTTFGGMGMVLTLLLG